MLMYVLCISPVVFVLCLLLALCFVSACVCLLYVFRGIQYVYCMMHKCIMVKTGGKKKHVGKKYINHAKTEGGNEVFSETEENVSIFRNRGENYKLSGNEILVDRNRNFLVKKVKLWRFFLKSEKCLEIGGGEIRNRGKMHHCVWGDGRPCISC